VLRATPKSNAARLDGSEEIEAVPLIDVRSTPLAREVVILRGERCDAAGVVDGARQRVLNRHYRETLTIVADRSRRLSRLVDDMLVLARADAGGYPLRPVVSRSKRRI